MLHRSPSTQTLSSPHRNTIPRISIQTLTATDFFEHYLKSGQPVILTHLFAEAPDWNLEYLSQQLGTQTFLLRRYGRDRYQQDKRQWDSIGSGVTTEQRSFLDYAAMLHTREAHEQDVYLAKCSITQTPLQNTETIQSLDQQLRALGLNQPISPFNIWIGPGGHNECLHYDPMDGTLVQLYGSKKIVLFPPTQTQNLYPFPIATHLWRGLKLRAWFSQLYPEQPDFESFPKFQQALAEKQEVILQPGEALFIPTGWWHEITALDDMVCSINRFWRVYPTRRAIFNWPRWRTHLASASAIPYILISLFMALFSPSRQEKIKAIRQMI